MSYLNRLNSLLTSTTSRYDSLRRNILSSSTEDDTTLTDPSASHVSRVLRAYYTEKSLPFPPWLGPDPRSPQPSASAQQQQGYATARPVGSLRGNASEMRSASSASGAGGGGLGDIWGEGQADGEGKGGLRRGVGRREQVRGGGEGGAGNVRPLPSQRVGSYQASRGGGGAGSPVPAGGGGGGGAAERLKARLNRGGSARGEEGGGGAGSWATKVLSGWQGEGGEGKR